MSDITVYKEEVVRVARAAYNRGLVPGSSGNLSMRLPDKNLVLIKASGVSFRDMSTNDVIIVDLDGNIIEGDKKPSKEIRFHLGIYRVRQDVGAVLHTHSPFATLYASLGKPIPLVVAGAWTRVKKMPIIDYAPAGSPELANMVTNAFKDPEVNVALLKNHGIVVTGKTLVEALDLTETIEDAAKIAAFYEILSFIYDTKKKVIEKT